MAKYVNGEKYISWTFPHDRQKATAQAKALRKQNPLTKIRVLPSEYFNTPLENKGLYQVYISVTPKKK